MSAAQASLPSLPSNKDRWAAFRALLEQRGFSVVDIPVADFTTTVQVDIATGRIIGRTDTLNPFMNPASTLPAAVFQSVGRVSQQAATEAATAVEQALASGDHVAAARTLVGKDAKLVLGLPPELLRVTRRIDVTQLPKDLATPLVKHRVGLAAAASDFGPETAGDLGWIRKNAWTELDDALKASVTLADGCVAMWAGRAEEARSIWKSVATGGGGPPLASARGWAWRNIATMLPSSDAEAASAFEQSMDAFLQAGQHPDAARSALRLAKCTLSRDPVKAMSVVDQALSWFDSHSIHDQDVRAGLLHSRAVALLKIGRFEDAAAAALSAAKLREGLHGVEAERASSLATAAIALRELGRVEEADARLKESDALIEASADDVDRLERSLAHLSQSFDASKATELLAEAQRLNARRDEALLLVLIATQGQAPHHERLRLLEQALQMLKAELAPHEDLNVVHTAIALELQRAGEPSRALAFWETVLANDPLDGTARQNIAALLFQLKRWRPAVDFFRSQRERFGDLPGLLYGEGKALLEAGDPAAAVRPLKRALELFPDGHPNKPTVENDLWTALDKCDGKPAPAPPPPAKARITRAVCEETLREFASIVKGERRQAFWRKGADKKRTWMERPERFAQYLLHMALRMKFGTDAMVFEEVSAGAGRLDLLVIGDDFQAILELKMLGGGTYPLSYALKGEDQILHYMENRNVRVGYLVVFDAREAFGTGIDATIKEGASLAQTVFVDVRPTWKSDAEDED